MQKLVKNNYFQTLKFIKEQYAKHWHNGGCDPYAIYDWLSFFTPIEYRIWCDIRYLGLPMYPQWPVLSFFLDFADPIRLIGIEVDGKQWHENKKQREKDLKRQKKLEELGWIIYRFTGSDTFKRIEIGEFGDVDGEEDYEWRYYTEEVLRKLKKEVY